MKPKFKVGKKVYVINWLKTWDRNSNDKGIWFDNIPLYSHHRWAKNKDDYQYEIVDLKPHPKAGELSYTTSDKKEVYHPNYIYLVRAPEINCYVEIAEDGISLLPKDKHEEQVKLLRKKELSKEHKGRWVINDDLRTFPKELVEVIYNSDDRVLFGSNVVKGLVTHNYIPGKYTKNKKNLYISTTISYDGKGLSALPSDVPLISHHKMKSFFPENYRR